MSSHKSTAEPAFSLEKVSFHYAGSETGLRDIDLEIEQGERIAEYAGELRHGEWVSARTAGLVYQHEGRCASS